MPELTVAVLTGDGGAHLDAYFTGLAATDEVTSVVVADPSGKSEATSKRLMGSKLAHFGSDLVQVLADFKPGLALVTTEAAHAPQAIHAALDANCHVLAEKPSCVRIEDFEPLVRLADMKHRLLMLAFANRLRTTIQQARQLIGNGQVGKIYGCELHIVADQTRLKNPAYHVSWFADRSRSGGGHLMWLGIHWIDLVMYLTDSKIIEVAGFTANAGGQPIKIEDSAVVAMRFDNGSLGTLTSGYYLDKGYHSHIKIWGSHGWLQLEAHGGEALQWYSTKDIPPEIRKYVGPADDATYTPLVKACARAALDLAPPPLTNQQSLHALRTVFACYRAAESGHSQAVG